MIVIGLVYLVLVFPGCRLYFGNRVFQMMGRNNVVRDQVSIVKIPSSRGEGILGFTRIHNV